MKCLEKQAVGASLKQADKKEAPLIQTGDFLDWQCAQSCTRSRSSIRCFLKNFYRC